jgi:UDP-N-acetylmuramoyl-tripeptide--D-alanyl-D-alanine ligase
MIDIPALYDLFLRCSAVSTDSREVGRGRLFFALRGDRFDGNDYAAEALAAGAAFAVVDRANIAIDERYLLVPNALTALQALARHHRRQFDIPIIGITGSNGKTTTKALIGAVLASHYPAHVTRGNFNNHVGVPLTLLAIPVGTHVAVVEMGANHVGEIDALCRIAEPTHGLITNIGKAHLEGFGGLKGVRRGKSELYRFLAEREGVAFVNRDAEHLQELAAGVNKAIFYGECRRLGADPGDPYEVARLATSGSPFVSAAFLSEEGETIEIHSQLVGNYNFQNIMSAIVVGKYFKTPAKKIKAAIEAYQPADNRSQLVRRGERVFILDAYNANPSSMREALDQLRDMPARRKIAVLGDMLELGQYAEQEHEAIARYACEQGFEQVVLVGPLFASSARRLGLPHFDDAAALRGWLESPSLEGGHFLLKGSRGMRLEEAIA